MTNITPIPPIPVAAPPGYRWIFCVSYVHWRSKKRVFRKNGGYFRFLVRAA
jgi:hypothetical protein